MDTFTLAQLRTKIEADLDLEEETFIQSAEFIGYVNEAIDKAEAKVHTLYEDYFLAEQALPLVASQKAYDLPATIYANKIRAIVFDNGSRLYSLRRLRFTSAFEDAKLIDRYPGSDDVFYYRLINNAATGQKINLYPTPVSSDPTSVTISFIRNAKRLALDADVCDLPDICANFVIAEVKVLCLRKEPGHPLLQDAIEERDRLALEMVETLTDRVPDGDNEVEKDFSIYEEMS